MLQYWTESRIPLRSKVFCSSVVRWFRDLFMQPKCGLLFKGKWLCFSTEHSPSFPCLALSAKIRSAVWSVWKLDVGVQKHLHMFWIFVGKKTPNKIHVWLFLARNLYLGKNNILKWITFLGTLSNSVGSGWLGSWTDQTFLDSKLGLIQVPLITQTHTFYSLF